MKSPKHSLKKIVSFINNEDEDGGFWLPNIQRPFVWDEDQICRLFDSILRLYPISTLLIWKTKSPIKVRRFIDTYKEDLRLTDFFLPTNDKRKCLVLDGQQRLQSLFIGLKGSYEGRELAFDVLSGKPAAPDDEKYSFEFLKPADIRFPFVKFKDLVFSTRTSLQDALNVIRSAGRDLSAQEEDTVSNNVALVQKTFLDDDGISYQELDSIDNPHLYGDSDVVEIFIRANSGGTRLGKSDLMFALLVATWDEAGEQLDDLLDELNEGGFAFTRDFILKTCLALLDLGAVYNVERFRTPEVKQSIESNWSRISSAIRDVRDFLLSKTFIRNDAALLSYLALIPLIYARYHFPNNWNTARDVDDYLLRTLLCGVYGGHSDSVVNACVDEVKQIGGFDRDRVFKRILSIPKALALPDDVFFRIGYSSPQIHLLFNLWYRQFHYTPSFSGNTPQVDHIFPQSLLKKVRNGNTMVYQKPDRDQLANCMLLTQRENGAGGKRDKKPEEWFADKDDAYLAMHLIPRDRSLLRLERFPEFIEARKQLIRERFSDLIA